MNKLDPTGESLESILASIRRSLSEQSTDVLADEGALPPVSLDTLGAVVPGEQDAPPRFLGNGGIEAIHPPGIPHPPQTPLPTGSPVRTDQVYAGLDYPPPPASISAALSRLPEEPPPTAPLPAGVVTPPQPEEGRKDPLWFLARGKNNKDGIPAPTPSVSPPPAAAQAAPASPAAPTSPAQSPAVAPKPVLKEIVRGPLPPFFGSSPEAAKVEVAPAPPIPGPMPVPLPGAAVIPPPAMAPKPAAAPSDAGPARDAAPDRPPHAPGVHAGAVGPVGSVAPAGPASGAVLDGLPNGKTHSLPVQPAAESPPSPAIASPAANPSQLQGLEAMVADLLRPMLRRWLDENMPRLVSAALKAEAETLSKRDPNKP